MPTITCRPPTTPSAAASGNRCSPNRTAASSPDRSTVASTRFIAGGRQVIVGIRPEHLRPAHAGDPGVLTVRIDRHDRFGGQGLLRFTVEAPLLMVSDPRDAIDPDPWAAERANRFSARLDDEGDADWTGRVVDLSVDPARIHLFDPATELAIR